MSGSFHAAHGAGVATSGLFAGVDPDHVPGLVAALLVPPAAWGFLTLTRALAARGIRPAERFVRGYERSSLVTRTAALLLLVSGFIHLGLVPGHARVDPGLAKLFFLNGVAFCTVAIGCFTVGRWRPFAAVLLVLTIFAYLQQVAGHHEDADSVGMLTKLIDLTALGLTLVPDRATAPRPTSGWRWTGTVAGVLVATVLTGGVTWAAGLAPDRNGHTVPAAEAALAAHGLGQVNAHAHHAAGMLLQPVPAAPPTAAQRAAAEKLVADTRAGIAKYENVNVAIADGYKPTTGPGGLTVHYQNWKYTKDGRILDPTRPEDLVYANTKHGPVLLGAMYMTEKSGQFGPDIGGPLTPWHIHDNICFSVAPVMVAGIATPFGTCPAGTVHITTPGMLHIWTIPTPTGSYGDLDPAWLKQFAGR